MTEHLCLIDMSGFVFRAYYALPALSRASDGLPIGAVAGVCNMLHKLPQTLPAFTHAAAVFDPAGGSFRTRLDATYKANRSTLPPELSVQFPVVRQAATAYGYPLLEVADFEADDVLATAAKAARAAGMHVTVVSSDKDLLQLLTDGVQIFDPVKNAPRDAAAALDLFGVVPERIADVQALAGDASDGVPGVPGIGLKTAAKLIVAAGSLSALLADPSSAGAAATPKLRQKLLDHKADAERSHQLVLLRDDVPLPPLDALHFTPSSDATKRAFFEEFELHARLRALPKTVVPEVVVPETVVPDLFSVPLPDSTLPFTTLSADTLLSAVHESGRCGIWIEPDGTVAIAPNASSGGILTSAQAAAFAQAINQNAGIIAVGLDQTLLTNAHDIRVLEYAVTGRSGRDDAPPPEVLTALDADPAQRAATMLTAFDRLQREAARTDTAGLYAYIDRPLVHALRAMVQAGVKIDVPAAQALSLEWGTRIEALEARIFAAVGHEFLLNSPKQLSHVLFDELGLPTPPGIKKNASGYYPTGAEVLETLEHPVIADILERRHLHKLKSTYADALPQHVDPLDGRVHGRFIRTGTATGRLASADPNLQNIPIKTAEGRRLRALFVPAPGNVLIAADYGQIELRLLAHIADVPAMRAAFAAGADIHAIVAEQLFGSSAPEFRRRAKAVNFGIIYGLSAFGLASQLHIARAEAKQFIDAYFAQYPQIADYMARTIAKGKQAGCVRTLFGRRILTPGMNDALQTRRAAAERAAINGPIQGTAADLMRRATVRVHQALRDQALQARIVLQVHDELVVEAPTSEAAAVRALLCERMRTAAEPWVRLSVLPEVEIKAVEIKNGS